MKSESEISAYERLSQNDRRILSRPEVRAAVLGVRPAAFEDWGGTLEDPMAVEQALRSEGIDAVVTPHMIFNVPVLEQRIAQEPDLAQEVGWEDGMNTRHFVERYQQSNRDHLDARMNMLRGFLLGFPASAIYGFKRREELKAEGIPWNVRDFLIPNVCRNF